MDETNNTNESLSRNNNNYLSNNQGGYPSLNNLNSQIVEINRHQDLMFYLRQIADNTAVRRRREEDCDAVSTIVIFLVTLFLIFMGINFYRHGGFETTSGPSLFYMIIGIFIAVVLLHREEEANTIKNIRCNK